MPPSNPFPVKPPKEPEDEQTIIAAQIAYGMCSQLLEHEAFKWLLTQLKVKHDDAQRVALDPDSTGREARSARHIRKTLQDIIEFTARKQASTREIVQRHAKH